MTDPVFYKLKHIFLAVMFSATFPRQMEALARRILNRPIEVQVGGRSVVCKDIEQTVSIVDEEGKFLLINYRFLIIETNLKALYIFRCFLTKPHQ